MINEKVLTKEERAVYSLRGIYRDYGYTPFKMTKFEEYDLYMQNKDFLVSENIITFNDRSGKLLALKPDVTLSIIKSAKCDTDSKQKLYYDENVYRTSAKSAEFREIKQTGIECIGSIDFTDIYEVLYLAAKSLDSISSDFVIDVSHMGILSAIIDSVSSESTFKNRAIKAIANKSEHELVALCAEFGIPAEKMALIVSLVSSEGNGISVLDILQKHNIPESAKEGYEMLSALMSLFNKSEFSSKIRVDFSVVNDMSYYNGVVFKGFINGISESVLSGGEYGALIQKIQGNTSGAIGFAIYVDMLGNNSFYADEIDVLLIYDEKIKAETIIAEKQKIIASGKSVYSSHAKCPVNIRYRERVVLEEQ